MRYSFALLAAVAAAAPQASVNPISQIGDGQIQAPTAPASVPYSAPAVSAPAVPSVPAVSVPAVPSVPAVSVPAGKISFVSSLPIDHVLTHSQSLLSRFLPQSSPRRPSSPSQAVTPPPPPAPEQHPRLHLPPPAPRAVFPRPPAPQAAPSSPSAVSFSPPSVPPSSHRRSHLLALCITAFYSAPHRSERRGRLIPGFLLV